MSSEGASAVETVEDLLGRYIEHHVLHGEDLAPEELCRDHPELIEPLREHVGAYRRLNRALAPPEELEPGRKLLHYRIVEKLGEGGMGKIYAAEDEKLGRRVALKLLPPEMAANPERLARFQREARAVAALNHPNIVTLHSVEKADGLHFLTMELLEGTTLKQCIGKGRMAPQEFFELAIPIAEALAAAHERGIIHRDLKPANVMSTVDGQVKVLDFGLAKLDPRSRVGGIAGASAELTGEGQFLGTVPYMSPEQLQGEPVDASTDIFSFGVMLYEMATGHAPFRGSSMAGVMTSILRDEPPPVTEANPALPDHLGRVVARCLEKEPRKRWHSAHDLAGELRDLASNTRAGEAKVRSIATVRSARQSRVRSWLSAATLSGAVLIGMIVFLLRLEDRQAAKGSPDEMPVAEQSSPEVSSYELYELGMAALDRFDKKGNLNLAIKYFLAGMEQDEDYAPVYSGLARAYWRQFQQTRDGAWLTKALPLAQRAVALDGLIAVSRARLGLVLSALGKSEDALREFDIALQLDPSEAEAYHGIGKVYEMRGVFEEAESAYEKAIELAPGRRLYSDDLGGLYFEWGRYEEAKRAFGNSIALAPESIISYRNLAAVHYMQGDLLQATKLTQRAILIEKQPSLYSNLGFYLFSQALYPRAALAFEDALRLGGRRDHQLWGDLADAHRWIPGNEKEARHAYDEAIRLLRDDVAKTPEDVELRSRLANYLAKRGGARQTEEALALARDVDITSASSAVLVRLVQAYEVSGERHSALEALRLAVEAGYPLEEFSKDPELQQLRLDVRYRQLAEAVSRSAGSVSG